MGLDGAPGGTRTPGLLVRSQSLYPAELRAREPIIRQHPSVPGRIVPVSDHPHIETEIKIRVSNPESASALLDRHGYRLLHPRVFETNTLYDTLDFALRRRGEIVRIRQVGERSILTFKSAGTDSRHKQREELETTVGDASILGQILERLGLHPAFRYEKYRAEYHRPPATGVVTLDETPVGVFLELEGDSAWIDDAAAEMGFPETDYILKSYGALYIGYCRDNNLTLANMVFDQETVDTSD